MEYIWMMAKPLRYTIQDHQEDYIENLLASLKLDPMADDNTKNYDKLKDYLWELTEKDRNKGSVLEGIIIALETYLEK